MFAALKRSFLILTLFLTLPSLAPAAIKSFSVNIFEPTIDDSEYFTIYGSPTMLKRNYHAGFYLDYAYHPYEFGNDRFDRHSGIVEQLVTGNFVGSYALLNWLSVGAVVPVYLFEDIDSPVLGRDETNFELGDIKLLAKIRLLDREEHRIGIAVVPFISFPTSTGPENFLGDGRFSGGGKVVIDAALGEKVTLALNLGYNARARVFDVGNNDLDDQFFAGLGLSVDVIRDKLKVIAEGQVATVVRDFYSAARTTPAEVRGGMRYTWARNHDLNAGLGLSVGHGIGNPDFRVLAGYTYTKRPFSEVSVAQPPISEIQVGDELTLKDKIYFEFDKDVIRDISKPTLDKIAAFLKVHPEITKIRIDGYTCDLGSDPYNLRLSQKRSVSVQRYLEGQGISPDRMGTVKGFGEEAPLVPNTDEANREQNRRVQIFVEEMGAAPGEGAQPAQTSEGVPAKAQ